MSAGKTRVIGLVVNCGRRVMQEAIILGARPYIRRELPGWGKVYLSLVGDYRRNWFWRQAPEKIIRGKFHGFLMHLNISHWGDRLAYFLGRWYDLETQLFIGDIIKPGDTIVDIGANRGMFTLCAARLVGPKGKVISFEPNPVSRAQMEREIEANGIKNVIVHPYGASNANATLELTVPNINSGEATFGKKDGIGNEYYTVTAQLVTADSLLKDEIPMLIKIDVEGFECKVIEGLVQTLKKHHPIVVTEIIKEHMVACGSSPATLTSLMSGLGYSGHRLSLDKNKKYSLRPMLPDENSFDAVWLPA